MSLKAKEKAGTANLILNYMPPYEEKPKYLNEIIGSTAANLKNHPLRFFISGLKRLTRSLSFIMLIYGILIGLLLIFKQQEKYEQSVFTSLENNIRKNVPDHKEETLLIYSMSITHHLLSSRDTFFKKQPIPLMISRDIHNSVIDDLISVSDACGSYTKILARLLQDMGFTIRIAQMVVNNKNGGHIIMEALTRKGWVVLDPMYNLYFINASGNMASFKEVASDWEFYKRSTPANYNAAYDYKDVRYTNWNKIPVIMPLLKKALNIFIGVKRADEISLRSHFVSYVRFYCNLFSFLLVILSAYIFLLLKRRHFKKLFITEKPVYQSEYGLL